MPDKFQYITPGKSLPADQLEATLAEFHREGFALVRDVLTAGDVQAIRDATDDALDRRLKDNKKYTTVGAGNATILRQTQQVHRVFCEMLIREPFLSIAEAILGPNPGFVGQNVIRTGLNEAITMWHVDDILEFPLPDDVPRHDARVKMPVFWFSFQIALSDLDSIEDGPTQIVPGSHYSGRRPPTEGEMEFEGRGPTPVLCKAGDIYLFNHQTWHRGSPNSSGKRRYLMQNQYCRNWGQYRFANKDNTEIVPREQLEGIDERLFKLVDNQNRTWQIY